jgi:hypothetical protein
MAHIVLQDVRSGDNLAVTVQYRLPAPHQSCDAASHKSTCLVFLCFVPNAGKPIPNIDRMGTQGAHVNPHCEFMDLHHPLPTRINPSGVLKLGVVNKEHTHIMTSAEILMNCTRVLHTAGQMRDQGHPIFIVTFHLQSSEWNGEFNRRWQALMRTAAELGDVHEVARDGDEVVKAVEEHHGCKLEDLTQYALETEVSLPLPPPLDDQYEPLAWCGAQKLTRAWHSRRLAVLKVCIGAAGATITLKLAGQTLEKVTPLFEAALADHVNWTLTVADAPLAPPAGCEVVAAVTCLDAMDPALAKNVVDLWTKRQQGAKPPLADHFRQASCGSFAPLMRG